MCVCVCVLRKFMYALFGSQQKLQTCVYVCVEKHHVCSLRLQLCKHCATRIFVFLFTMPITYLRVCMCQENLCILFSAPVSPHALYIIPITYMRVFVGRSQNLCMFLPAIHTYIYKHTYITYKLTCMITSSSPPHIVCVCVCVCDQGTHEVDV